MTLDPAAVGLLQQMEDAGMPALNEMTPEEARIAAGGFVELGGPGDDIASSQDRVIAGPAGDIPVRVYTPHGSGPFGCLVYFHGGGWVIGDIEGTNAICRTVAARAGCKVVSVGYRLAPEFKFPVPLDDCYAATEWVVENAAEIGIDGSKIAVGGDSAGGNLAAAVAIKARDADGPAIALQVLVYPVTNHSYDTQSYKDNGEGHLLTTELMTWFWDQYLESADDGRNPLASPLRASDLSGLPPAVVITAEYDPLRDEGEAYASALSSAGVAVTQKRFDGQIHAFWQMLAVFEQAYNAADMAAAELKKAFA